MTAMNFYSKIIILATSILCFCSCMGTDEAELVGKFLPPQVSVTDATISNKSTTVVLNASYKQSSSSAMIDEVGFYYGEDPELTASERLVASANTENFSVKVLPNTYGKEYFYKAYLSNGKGEILSSVKSFTKPAFDYYVTLDVPKVVAVSGSDVTISSTIRKAEGITLSEVGVFYSVDADVTIDDNKVASNDTETINIEIKGLTTGAKYYMRSYVMDREYIAFSETVEFVPHAVPSLTTANVSDISYTTAVSGGTYISDNGLDITSKGVVWSTKANPTIELETKTENGSGKEEFVANVIGLSPGTKYYIRAFAINSDGVGYGNEITFETLPQSNATVTTNAPSEVTSSSAMSGGNVTSDGGAKVTSRGVVWSKDHNPTISFDTKTSDGSGIGKFTSAITGLEPGTTYYVRAYATNALGTSYGEEVSFTTQAVKPTVSTTEADEITQTSAKVGGNVTATGGAEVTERGIVWSISKNPTTSDNKKQVGNGVGSFTTELADLEIATTYYVRAYAINSVGTSYGEEISFTTGSAKPTVTTVSPSEVTSSSAVSGGNVTSDGGSAVTARGVVWSKDHNPTVSLSTKTMNGTGTGNYVSSISGLEPGVTYYVRAYATNANGTSYGDEVSFTTQAVKPTVSTTEADEITQTSAKVGGNVTATGGAEVTERGIVWSTSKNPTTSDNKKQVGSGTGSFTTELTDLKIATIYYVRAYATNSVGTSYGEEISFTTGSAKPTVTTVSPSEVTSSSAVSGGNVTSDGGSAVTARGVVWSKDHNPKISLSTKTMNGTGTGSYVSSITGLEPGVTYYVRAYATNANGTSYGDEVSFTTTAVKPTVTTSDATDVTTSSAKVGGNVTATGGAEVTERGIVWSASKNPTTSDNKKQVGNGVGSFTTELADLEIATTYYVRAYAINSVGTSYGEEISFTTGSAKPTVTTVSPSEVTSSSAVSGGNVTSDGGSAVTARGVVWSKDHNPKISLSTKTMNGTGTGSYVSSITGLEPGVTYYVRAYATNANGTSYGEEMSFTTNPVVPTVSTNEVSDDIISGWNIPLLGGNVTETGGAEVIERGLVWSSLPKPTVEENKIPSGSGLGQFEVRLYELSFGTRYYIRAYAINSAGISYGDEVTFYVTSLYFDYKVVGITENNYPQVRCSLRWSDVEFADDDYFYFGYLDPELGSNVDYRCIISSGPLNFLATDLNEYIVVEKEISLNTKYNPQFFIQHEDRNIIVYGEPNSPTYVHEIPAVQLSQVQISTLLSNQTTLKSEVSYITDLEYGFKFNTITNCGIVWSTEPNPTIALQTKTDEGGILGTFTSTITGLTANTTYYARPYAVNPNDVVYGDQIIFMTPKQEGATEDLGNECFEW